MKQLAVDLVMFVAGSLILALMGDHPPGWAIIIGGWIAILIGRGRG